jgi:transmembrane sensor
MDYNKFTVFDFLKDEFFVKWAINPDAATREYWQRWLKNHPEKNEEVSRAIEIIQSLKLKEVYKMDNSRYEKILDRVILYQQKQQQGANIYSIKRSSFRYWSVAASLALIMVIGIALFSNRVGTKEASVVGYSTEMLTKITPAGVKLTVQLSDGTIIKMNSGTMLTYPERFSDSIRLVYLEGEAFFEVAKNPEKPFVIKTGLAEAEVLGTSFNIRAFGNDEAMEVALISGSVWLKNKLGGEQILEPYERGIVNRNQPVIIKDQFDVKEIVGWKDGILLFKKATFEQVVKKLEHWYGAEFEVNPSVKGKGVYSGEFRNETLEHVLSGIAYSYGLKYEINGKKVNIYE